MSPSPQVPSHTADLWGAVTELLSWVQQAHFFLQREHFPLSWLPASHPALPLLSGTDRVCFLWLLHVELWQIVQPPFNNPNMKNHLQPANRPNLYCAQLYTLPPVLATTTTEQPVSTKVWSPRADHSLLQTRADQTLHTKDKSCTKMLQWDKPNSQSCEFCIKIFPFFNTMQSNPVRCHVSGSA